MARQSIIQRFHDRSAGSGSPWAMDGWSSQQSQQDRFDAMIRASSFSSGDIVDFGCGTGELLGYLRKQGVAAAYTGIDFRPEIINVARHRHGDHFRAINFGEMGFDLSDYVFASGVFQFCDDSDPGYPDALVQKLFSRTRVALAITFLSSSRDASQKTSNELYIDPCRAASMAASLTPFWRIDHAYHPGSGDLTVALLRRNIAEVWRRPPQLGTDGGTDVQ